jgi:hypothetical protein
MHMYTHIYIYMRCCCLCIYDGHRMHPTYHCTRTHTQDTLDNESEVRNAALAFMAKKVGTSVVQCGVVCTGAACVCVREKKSWFECGVFSLIQYLCVHATTGGYWLGALISMDAFLVLSGAVLTAYVGTCVPVCVFMRVCVNVGFWSAHVCIVLTCVCV